MLRVMTRPLALAALLALPLGCDRGPSPPPDEEEAAPAVPTHDPSEATAERRPPPPNGAGSAAGRGQAPTVDPRAPQLAGVRWAASEPLTWRDPSRPMRNAEYVVSEGDAEAILTVFHFPGMGGSIEDNVARWTGQFQGGDEAEVSTETIGGLEVTTVDVTGTFASAMGMGGGAPQPETRLLGAIVQGPDGPLFFKLLGPKDTVAEAQDAFAALVQSFEAVR